MRGFGDFSSHVADVAGVWKGVIGHHGDSDVNDIEKSLLQLCCDNELCIMNIFFQLGDLHKCTW